MKKINLIALILVFILSGCISSDDESSDTHNSDSDYYVNVKYDNNNPDIFVTTNTNGQAVARSVSVISKDYDDFIYIEANSDDGVGYVSYFNTNAEGITMKLNSKTYEYESFIYSDGSQVDFLSINGPQFQVKMTNASGYTQTTTFESDALQFALDEMLGNNEVLQKAPIISRDVIDEIESVSRKGLGKYFKDGVLDNKDDAIATIAGLMYGFQGYTTIAKTTPTFLTQPFTKIKTTNGLASVGFLANTMAMRAGESEKAPAYKYATEVVDGLEECNGWIDCTFDLFDNTLAYAQVTIKGKPEPENHPIESLYFYHEDSKSKQYLNDVSLSFHKSNGTSIGSAIYARKGSHFSAGPLTPNETYYINVVVIDENGEDRFDEETYSIINDGNYIQIRDISNNNLISQKTTSNSAIVAIPLYSLLCGKDDTDLKYCTKEECSDDIFDDLVEYSYVEKICYLVEIEYDYPKRWDNWPEPEFCAKSAVYDQIGFLGNALYYNIDNGNPLTPDQAQEVNQYRNCFYLTTNPETDGPYNGRLWGELTIDNTKDSFCVVGIEKGYSEDGDLKEDLYYNDSCQLDGEYITYGDDENSVIDCRIYENGVDIGSCMLD